jgi:D-amino-acid dehydrogenase
MNVAVIGAGITGLTAAYYLARAGHRVTVYDSQPHPAMRCSYANGGQISVSNSEVWNSWSNIGKGIKWMFKADAPLLLRPSLDWRQWSWLARFVYHTAAGHGKFNTAQTIKMGLESRELYKEMIEEEGLQFDQSDSGILHIYKNPVYFDHAIDSRSLYESNGCEWQVMPGERMTGIDFNLKDINGVVGLAWTPSDWTGDIHKFCMALSKVLRDKYNVRQHYGSSYDMESIAVMGGYDKIVVSAGVGSVRFARELGDDLPIYPVKGYSITITVPDDQVKYLPKVSLLDDEAKIVTSTLGNRLRVAGTAEFAGENYDIRHDRIEPLLCWVHTNFPRISTHDYSSWACLRPMTPNMLPIVKRSEHDERVYYHCGHGHLGWTLSPYTAELLSRMIDDDHIYSALGAC